MTRAAQLPRLNAQPLQRHALAIKANIDALEREVDRLKARLDVLEARDAWFRDSFYPWAVSLAVAVPFTAPPELPD